MLARCNSEALPSAGKKRTDPSAVPIAFSDPADLAILSNAKITLEEYIALCDQYVVAYDDITPLTMAECDTFSFSSSSNTVQIKGAIDEVSGNEKLNELMQVVKAAAVDGSLSCVINFCHGDNKPAKWPHPKTLLAFKEKKLELLDGGLLTPSHARPVGTLVQEEGKLYYCVNGGLCGNMQSYSVKRTYGSLGCKELPDCIKDQTIQTKEEFIHVVKVLAACLHPELRGAGASEEDCMQLLQRLGDSSTDSTGAKKIGQQIKLSQAYFELCPNNGMLAGVVAALLHIAEEPALKDLLKLMSKHQITVVEAAMHKAEGSFQGYMQDLGWGSAGGGVQCCTNPFGITMPKKAGGVFARVMQTVTEIIERKPETLALLGLESVPEDDYVAAAATVFDRIMVDTRKAASTQAQAQEKQAEGTA